MPAAVFFDTETSGLPLWKAGAGHPDQPHLMQLGAILQDLDTRRVLNEINLLVQIPPTVTPAPQAVDAHKITPEMCKTYGVQPNTALRMFNLMLQRAEVVVAHNLNFDSLIYEAAVLRNADHCDMGSFRDCRPFCTMLTSTPMCRIPSFRGGFKWPTLKEAYAHFLPQKKWDDDEAHDAMYDVRACRDIYFAIQDHLAKQ